MLRSLLNLSQVKKVKEDLEDIVNDLSDEEWERMDKKLDMEIDKLLSRGIMKKKMTTKRKKVFKTETSSKNDVDAENEEEDNWTSEELLDMMKEMEFDRRKRRSGSNFWFNAFIGTVAAVTVAYLGRLYIDGEWRSIDVCKGSRPAEFCHRCYGPFSGGEWLWCL